MNKNILNSFEKRAVINSLSDLNVFGLVLTTNKQGHIFYVFFYKIEDMIFSESVFFASYLHKFDSIGFDKFIEKARKKIGYIIHDVNKYLLCKYGDISDKRYQAERIVSLIRMVHSDYYFAKICSHDFENSMASVLEVEITDKISVDKLSPIEVFNGYFFDNLIDNILSEENILKHKHIYENPGYKS